MVISLANVGRPAIPIGEEWTAIGPDSLHTYLQAWVE